MKSHPRRRQRPGAALRWTIAALVALAAHGLFALFVSLTGFGGLLGKIEPPPETKLSPVALRAVPRSAWEQNRSAGRKAPASDPLAAAEPLKPEVEKKKEPERKPDGRVVDVAPGNGQKPDDDAKFLAETNNRVDKETISRDRTLNYRNAAPRPTTTVKANETAKGHDAVEKPVLAGNEGTGNDPKEPSEGRGKAMLEIPSTQRRDRLALKLDGLGGNLMNQEAQDEIFGNSHRLRIQAGGEEGGELTGSLGKAGTRELRTLMPSAAVLDRIIGAPASDVSSRDDIEEGDGTFLNTREWKHSSFFNRVKQNVGMHWDPNTLVRRRDPTGELYLYKDRYTVLSVTLDSEGRVKTASVDRSSGVDFLDTEAIEAFRRAQPFPNPPPALQDERGEIRFTFGFLFEVNRGGLQLFR